MSIAFGWIAEVSITAIYRSDSDCLSSTRNKCCFTRISTIRIQHLVTDAALSVGKCMKSLWPNSISIFTFLFQLLLFIQFYSIIDNYSLFLSDSFRKMTAIDNESIWEFDNLESLLRIRIFVTTNERYFFVVSLNWTRQIISTRNLCHFL